MEPGDQHDSASGIPSASKVALALDRYLRGLEVQAKGALVMGFGPLGRWAMG